MSLMLELFEVGIPELRSIFNAKGVYSGVLNNLLAPFGPFIAWFIPPVINTFFSTVAGRLDVRFVSAALGDDGLFY